MASTSRHPRVRNRQIIDSESDEEDRPLRHESASQPQTIDLSDDENVVPPVPPFQQQMPSGRHPVGDILRSRGVAPRAQWLDSCINALALNQPGFVELNPERQAELCFAQFLMADFNVAGDGCFPPSADALHGTVLAGPFVLQVDEVADIGQPLRERYQERPAKPGRVLKLSMTDGVQRLFGIEYRPIKALNVLSPAGLKISVKNVCIRRGLLLLVPEIVEILGGHVERLESARVRAVQFINKPPRGRWVRRNETEPPLIERATAAAWPENQAGDRAAPSASSRQYEHQPSHSAASNTQGAGPTVSNASASFENHGTESPQPRTEHRPAAHGQPMAQPGNASYSHGRARESHTPPFPPQSGQQAQRMEVDEQASVLRGASSNYNAQRTGGNDSALSSGEVANNPGDHWVQAQRMGNSDGSAQVPQAQGDHDGGNIRQVPQAHRDLDGGNVGPWNAHSAQEPASMSTTPRAEQSTSIPVSGGSNGASSGSPSLGRLSLQSRRAKQAKFTSPLAPPQTRADEQWGGPNEFEQQRSQMENSTISRNEASGFQNAFTYLAVLKSKIVSERNPQGVVRGRVKCVISGVINFQYKGCDEYKLRIYIEDGSLITPAFVHHQLVQRLIGYPPRDVMSRLGDPVTRKEMADNMIRFQKLLEKFEGFMEVEWSKLASGPTAVNWSEGMEYESIRLCVDRSSNVASGSNRNFQASKRYVPTIDLTEES